MMRHCRNCGKTKWEFSFNDDTRIVTAVCKSCGKTVSFQSKKRKIVKYTAEYIMNKDLVMACFEYGKLVEPTPKDILETKLYIINNLLN